MKLEYLHRAGGFVHQGPSGTIYEFNEDADGRRVAEVKNPDDQARFLSLTDARGNGLFVPVKSGKKTKETDKSENTTEEKAPPVTQPVEDSVTSLGIVESGTDAAQADETQG